MLDLKLIRNETEKVTSALLKRIDNIDFTEILELDIQRRTLQGEIGNKRAVLNELSRQVGQLRAQKKDSAEEEKSANEISFTIDELESKLSKVESELQQLLAQLPNIPDERIPSGGKENNEVVRVWGEKPDFQFTALDHTELCRKLDLVDYDRGTKLGGSGFWLYSGLGAALEWALLNYFCRKHFVDGYKFFLPPHLLINECGYAAGQFPKFYDDVFHLQTSENDRERFLLPTAETAVLNVYRDEILNVNQLPLKCFAYTPCYRRESGSYRTEERGTIRGHQFNKVEMFQFVAPEQSEDALQELVNRAQTIMEELGLHYRTSMLAAKDTSHAMAITFDVEVWLPSINSYKEVSSISCARDYQARRANIRYRPKGSNKTEYIHTLNGSGLATSRLFPAIVEQFQQPDGSIIVPEPLREWIGLDKISPR